MRGKQAIKRKINPDPKYNSIKIAKFINYIMKGGKKSIAQKIIFETFDIIKTKTKQNPVDIFEQAIKNVSPVVELRSRRIGGTNYQIPYKTNEARQFTLASKWIISSVKKTKGKTMPVKLAAELMQAANNEGETITKKDNIYKMAKANKAFAPFAR